MINNKQFIKKVYKQNTELKNVLPDKEPTYRFIEKLFNFISKMGANRMEVEIEKDYTPSLQNYLVTSIYGVANAGLLSQRIA